MTRHSTSLGGGLCGDVTKSDVTDSDVTVSNVTELDVTFSDRSYFPPMSAVD